MQCDNTCTDSSSSWKSHNSVCNSTDYKADMAAAFGSAPYLLQEAFESDCETFRGASGLLASGDCEQVIMYVDEWGFSTYEKIQLEANGSLSIRYFTDQECSTPLDGNVTLTFQINAMDTDVNQTMLNSSSCDENGYRYTYFTSTTSDSGSADSGSNASNATTSGSSSSSSGSSVGLIAGIVGGIVALVLIVAGLFFYCRHRSTRKNLDGDSNSRTSSTKGDSNSLEGAALGQSGLWNDDVITAKRIARREIQVKNLISRGAFGEVYEGVFNDKRVAVKMLSPEIRGRIRYVNNFLAEAKLTASMEHPHVVHFIGVAWDTLSDLCVVMEFMEGGDLRSLLSEYEQSGHPVGIDREKATIALHVCHALTYLHSLAPPIIHRDLKSRNILLTHDLKAKVTDFGISREKLDQTMTAGVGTSLWMAPEVMLGERYDDKADIFSFGVVLSELDLHTLPYAQAKDKNRDSNGHRFPDALLLQQVAMGKLRVEFSEGSPRSLVEVGVACVSVDPRLRPTAAEALYKLQKALTQELKQLTKTCE
ncbi:hypothetical protein PHYSODRAFT_476596 [Phytophthora sojae]|uniref:Protein kinase domain-containing protein n=1 Tax=Phytophthora sojae (strain P6497) TaxID=1094619 RepID=G4YFI6_PHYSP|nr:hypothetical protein PHYSODRAFT_476596 [Phytophthora sojae]EGZ26971.1 hypothetical protein PHYSODRAFT_476596 [Phytophthora sojae]|eukprot:XP_009514246.1 hypothetical protein PHYSODRAFT_476596 [Phytophthora sojae]